MVKKTKTRKTKAKISSKKTRTKDGSKKVRAKAPPKTKRAEASPAPASPDAGGAIVGGTDPCACGRAPEEHGRDANHPSWTGCTESDCLAYESDPGAID
jgi:hypothetical protein